MLLMAKSALKKPDWHPLAISIWLVCGGFRGPCGLPTWIDHGILIRMGDENVDRIRRNETAERTNMD